MNVASIATSQMVIASKAASGADSSAHLARSVMQEVEGGARGSRGMAVAPRTRRLKGGRGREHHSIRVATANDLETDGQAIVGPSGGDAACGLPREIEREREGHPAQDGDVATVDLPRRPRAEWKRRHGDGGGQQQIEAREERRDVLPDRIGARSR